MLLAELEIRHSRAVAPTRRVALGERWLPTDPAPGYGGILLGGIVATHLGDVAPELRDEFMALAADLEEGRRIAQPRMRHRFQTDVVGLDRTRHKLVRSGGESAVFQIDGFGPPPPSCSERCTPPEVCTPLPARRSSPPSARRPSGNARSTPA